MDLDSFSASVTDDRPPGNLSVPLVALWYDANGAWHDAHAAVQSEPGADSAWVHAYLHRCEGDLANAAYWYRRAGRAMPEGSLQSEWQALVRHFLAELA